MDSFKTGEFIKNLRIEKGLTQKELAEALNCTDKAISRWETGKGFPDIVFLTPLAQTLGVTVNELLTGEKLSQEELVSKSDEVIISTMQEAENDKKKLQGIIFAVLCAIQVLTIYIITIFEVPDEAYQFNAILYMIICIFTGLLKVKVKYAFPLIVMALVLPLEFIRNGFDDLWPLFLLLSLTLALGLVLICGTTFIKNIVIRVFKKWKKEDKFIKAITAITLVLSIILGAVWIVYYEKNTEKVDVIEHIDNDETHIDELIYNGTTYYSTTNYVSQNYNKFLDSGELLPRNFPISIWPYDLDKTVDLSICTEYLPELSEGQKYTIEEDYYFIHANDSITKPTIIYIFADNSYYEWFISEDFDFAMPTTDTHDVADIVLYENYGDYPILIKGEEKINEIITAKNNREDISKYVTTEEYGNWTYIYIRYKDSPFIERIGFLYEDGTFEYEESWQEQHEENPYGFYVAQ